MKQFLYLRRKYIFDNAIMAEMLKIKKKNKINE